MIVGGLNIWQVPVISTLFELTELLAVGDSTVAATVGGSYGTEAVTLYESARTTAELRLRNINIESKSITIRFGKKFLVVIYIVSIV